MKKNMKKLLVIVMALMPGLSINCFAQDPGGSNGGDSGGGTEANDPSLIPVKQPISTIDPPRILPGEPDPIPIKQNPNPNPHPNPGPRSSVQDPYCYHIDGVVYIEADTTVTYINATVTRSSDGQVWSATSASCSLSISTSADVGEYCLDFTLSTGQSYMGKYKIE